MSDLNTFIENGKREFSNKIKNTSNTELTASFWQYMDQQKGDLPVSLVEYFKSNKESINNAILKIKNNL